MIEQTAAVVVTEPDMDMPGNTDLSTQIDAQPIPTGVSPLVAMLASGQLTTELVDQALDLQEKHDAYEAKKLFNIAIANFRSSVTNVTKDSTGHNGKFASLGAIANAAATPLGENGLSYYWTQNEFNNELHVTCHLTHAAGHSIETSMSSPPEKSGGKTEIHAKASAISYLKRYTLTSLLGLATEDDDGQNATPKAPPAPMTDKVMSQIIDLIDTLSEAGQKAARDYYIRAYGEDDTPLGIAVPSRETGKVVAALKKKIAAEKKASEKAADGDAL